MRNAMPCVGLVILAGCLTFIVTPDEQPSIESEVQSALHPGFSTVVLDPGHGGRDDGARGNGLVEKDLTLDVALRVERTLQQFKFHTVLTRRDNAFVSLGDRTAIANKLDNAIFVSIHFNHAPDSTSSGVETFYANVKAPPEAAWTWMGFFNRPEQPAGEIGETLAGFIQASLVMRLEATNRGIKSRDLYVTRHTRCPAVLVEGGFMNNPLEARLLANAEYRERLARGIAEGVMSYEKTRPRPAAAPEPLAQMRR